MADTEYKRLVHSAKERALLGYLAMVQRAIQDADKQIVESLLQAKSGVDQSALTAVRHFLRQDSNDFLRRVDTLFRGYLDRAMQTMFVDFRPGMRKLSANELSLIDDDSVNHQIEVGRLTERMRDANEESIGRLNVIVAQLHGEQEPRERENPFRPYLLARALYEAVKESEADENKAKIIFERLASALIPHLPQYYASIREVFEASGVQGKFRMERSRAAHHQRYFGAPSGDLAHATQFSARLLPGLQHMMQTMQAAFGTPAQAEAAQSAMQEFVRTLGKPTRSFFPPGSEPANPRAVPRSALVTQLDQLQKSAAGGNGVEADPNGTRLSALSERINASSASPTERMTTELVAMLFEFILEDEQLAPEFRRHIGSLQIPVLKAALLDQNFVRDEGHPARQLLNRLGSAAAGVDPRSPHGRKLDAEMQRIARTILAEFDTDAAVFARRLQEFERFLAHVVREDDRSVANAMESVELAERFGIQLHNTTDALCSILLPLNVDKGVADFLTRVWPQVLVRAAWQDMKRRIAPERPDSLFQQYRQVVPELLWSIQEKNTQAERAALIRLLPGMVKRLREALALIQLPEEESKEIMDLLVQMHTQILRSPATGEPAIPSLEDLQQQFARVVVRWDRAAWELPEPPQPRPEIIEEIFAQHQLAVGLHEGVKLGGTSQADRDFLARTYLIGTRVEIVSPDRSSAQAQLVWVSTHRSLYLFRVEGKGGLELYTYAALLEALRDETVVPLEYAPVFERAMESLLYGMQKLPAAAK